MKDLSLILPVYNEEAIILKVVKDWLTVLQTINLTFDIHIYNDGSNDQTLAVLQNKYQEHANVHIFTHPNQGHGPTILGGYQAAIGGYTWIFQCDSDNEISADHFFFMWKERNQFDLLIGSRIRPSRPLFRRLLSFGSKMVIRIFFGSAVQDVNAPYRLIRSEFFAADIKSIPPSTFAPNVLISGLANSKGARVFNLPVPNLTRTTGTYSIKLTKIFEIGLRCIWQTLIYKISVYRYSCSRGHS